MKKPVKKNAKDKSKKLILDERVKPIIEAIEAAAALFDQESDVLEAGGPLALESLYEQKREMEKRIKAATVRAVDDGLSLQVETPEAQAIEKSLEVLRIAANRNAESLQGVQNALDHVNSLIRRSASDNGSEGMYDRHAKKVDARAKTMVGFGISI